MKDIDLIISHPLLRDDNLFTSVDDEVAACVMRTLSRDIVIKMAVLGQYAYT